jgi:Raf kinase inhibitor-like YbhB/YbcL family protein
MYKLRILLLSIVVTGFAGVSYAEAPKNEVATFKLESSTFKDGEFLPLKTAFDKFDCGGQNVLPQLKWTGAPAGTKSFVITVYDPDAPTISGFWHWGLYNIPANITELDESANSTGGFPAGVSEIFTDYGFNGYGGSCPPVGDKPHRYHFTIYALDVEKLELDPAKTTGAFLMFNVRSHTLAKAQITGLYERKK